MIESPAGVKALPELLEIGGVDGVLIGPHDLSVSHGVPEQYDHPVFEAAVKSVIAVCQAADVGVGVHFISGTMERAFRWAEWGCNLICQRVDTLFNLHGAENEISSLRQRLDGIESTIDMDKLAGSGHAT